MNSFTSANYGLKEGVLSADKLAGIEYKIEGNKLHRQLKAYAKLKASKLKTTEDKNKFVDRLNANGNAFSSVIDNHGDYRKHVDFIDRAYSAVTDKRVFQSPKTSKALVVMIAWMFVVAVATKFVLWGW